MSAFLERENESPGSQRVKHLQPGLLSPSSLHPRKTNFCRMMCSQRLDLKTETLGEGISLQSTRMEDGFHEVALFGIGPF